MVNSPLAPAVGQSEKSIGADAMEADLVEAHRTLLEKWVAPVLE